MKNNMENHLKTCTLTNVSGDKDVIVVPSSLGDYEVSNIGSYCFYGNTKVKKIILPDTVKEIKNNAFDGCINLKEIVLSKNIESIGFEAFNNCSKLEKIIIDSPNFKFNSDFVKGASCYFKILTTRRFINADDFDDYRNIFKNYYADYLLATGYDKKYDSDNHNVMLSKEGLYYFVNEEGKIVITHGEQAYDFGNKDVVIPELIDNKPVYAIGFGAFCNSVFLSMIIPETVKVIHAKAFFGCKFNYLQFPRHLEYLHNEVFSQDTSFDSNLDLMIQQTLTFNSKFNQFTYFVLMPDKIDEKDYNSFEVRPHIHLVFLQQLSEKDRDKAKIDFIYDKDTYISYIIKEYSDYSKAYIIDSPIIKNSELPKEINNVKIVGYDVLLILNLKKRFLIPDYITEIVSFFNTRLDLTENSRVIFHPNIKVYEYIKSDYDGYFVLNANVEYIRHLVGRYFVEEGSKLANNANDEMIDSGSIFYGLLEFKSNENFKYAVFKNENKLEVFLIEYIGNWKKVEIPLFIDSMPVIGSMIDYKNRKIYSYEIYGDGRYNRQTTWPDRVKKGIIHLPKTVNKFENYMKKSIFYMSDFLIVSDGIEEICSEDELYIPQYVYTEEKKILFPKTLKNIGKNGLGGLSEFAIYIYEGTHLDEEAGPQRGIIKIYNNKGVVTKIIKKRAKYDINMEVYNSNIMAEILRTDLSSISQNAKIKADEVLNKSALYNFEYLEDEVRCECHASNDERYLVWIILNRYENALEFHCNCPSFINTRIPRCKHINALMFYIKKNFYFSSTGEVTPLFKDSIPYENVLDVFETSFGSSIE